MKTWVLTCLVTGWMSGNAGVILADGDPSANQGATASTNPPAVKTESNAGGAGPAIPLKDELGPAAGKSLETPRTRPRTLEAARQQKGLPTGREKPMESLTRWSNAQFTAEFREKSFESYDKGIISAIERRWRYLLEREQRTSTPPGRLVLEFHLLADGAVTDLKTVENSMGDYWRLLSERAVLNCAPFPPWPSDFKLKMEKNFREVRISLFFFKR